MRTLRSRILFGVLLPIILFLPSRFGQAMDLDTAGPGMNYKDDRGYGSWRLGMSKASVRSVVEFAPYKEVPSTGGLETPNGVFEGRKTNISFVFGAGGLQIIQIWAYEGQSLDAAVDVWYRVRQYLSRLYGAVEVPLLKAAADLSRVL